MKNKIFILFLVLLSNGVNSYAANPSGNIPVNFSLYKAASIHNIKGFNFGKIVIDANLIEEGTNQIAVFSGTTDTQPTDVSIKAQSVTGALKQAEFTLSGDGVNGFTLASPSGKQISCSFIYAPSGTNDSNNLCSFAADIELETGVILGAAAGSSLSLLRNGTSVKFSDAGLNATKTYLTDDANYSAPNKSYILTLTVDY